MAEKLYIFIITVNFELKIMSGVEVKAEILSTSGDGAFQHMRKTHYIAASHEQDAKAYVERLYARNGGFRNFEIVAIDKQNLDAIIRTESMNHLL